MGLPSTKRRYAPVSSATAIHRTLLLAVLCWAIGVGGCASTHQVDLSTPDAAQTLQDITKVAQRKKTKVTLADGQRTTARTLATRPDSTAWTVRGHAATRIVMPTAEVRRIRFTRRPQGAIEGMTLGALAGLAAAFGQAVSSRSFEDASQGFRRFVPIGGAVGFVLGALRGNRRAYVLVPLPPGVEPLIADAPQQFLAENWPETDTTAQAADTLHDPEDAITPPEETPTPEARPAIQEEASPAAQDTLIVQAPAEPAVADSADAPPLANTPNDDPAENEQPPTDEAAPVEEVAPAEEPDLVEEAAPVDTTQTAQAAPPVRQPPPSEPAPRFNHLRGGWTIVVASYTEPDPADAAVLRHRERLAGTGYPVDMAVGLSQGVARFRVVVGQFETLEAGQAALADLAGQIPRDAWVMRLQARSALPSPQAEAEPETEPETPEPAEIEEAAEPAEAEPETPAEAPPPRAQIDRQAGGWTVVLASHPAQAAANANAARYRDQLRNTSHPVAVIAGVSQGVARFRVVVGQFETLEAGQAALADLAGQIPRDAWLLRLRPE